MDAKNEHLESLHDIRQMMAKSSRFISLSGLSGIGAGVCALGGSFFAYRLMFAERAKGLDYRQLAFETGSDAQTSLLMIGGTTFLVALIVAFLFTYLRSRKTGVAIWGITAQKLLWNTMIPLVVGGIVAIRFIQWGYGGLVAPACLLFYGLALINGSKYTLSEIRWLGFSELILGIANLWLIGYGLMFWTFGFGILHIVYGVAMWWKYERV